MFFNGCNISKKKKAFDQRWTRFTGLIFNKVLLLEADNSFIQYCNISFLLKHNGIICASTKRTLLDWNVKFLNRVAQPLYAFYLMVDFS